MEYVILIGLLLLVPIAMSMDLSWNNVLESARNSMVFAGRNQDYGAFTLRRDYVRGLLMAVVGSILFFGLAIAIFLGVVIGTYSSIYIAAPVLVWLGVEPDSFVKAGDKEEAGQQPA
jgi:hypothetical protein